MRLLSLPARYKIDSVRLITDNESLTDDHDARTGDLPPLACSASNLLTVSRAACLLMSYNTKMSSTEADSEANILNHLPMVPDFL